MADLLHKELSYQVQGAFFEVYKSFNNAFKEKVYHNALVTELKKRGLKIETEKRINIFYQNEKVGVYVPDIVVEDCIIIELKRKPKLTKSDLKQFWQYLKGSKYKVGYLVNFGQSKRVEYIRRVYDTAREV